MTMNDHEGEGEGFRNDHVVRWIDIFFIFNQKTAEFSISAAQFACLGFGIYISSHKYDKKAIKYSKNRVKWGVGE